MSSKQIRVGIMLNGYTIKAWQYLLIENLLSLEYINVCGLIINQSKTKPRKQPLISFLAFKYFDKKLFPVKHDPFEKMDATGLFNSKIEKILVSPKEGKYTDRFSNEDVFKIKEQQFDVIIRLGFRILKGEILNSSKHGIWSLHHGDNEENRGSPPGFWEVLQNKPITGSILQILTEDLDNGKTIYRSFSATDKISMNRTIAPIYWKSSFYFERKLNELYQTGKITIADKKRDLNLYSNILFRPPTNLKLLSIIPRHLGKVLSYQCKRVLFKQQWGLYFQFGKSHGSSMWRFKKLKPPNHKMWADPFIIYHEGKHFVFIEEMEFKKKKGHISYFELNKKQKEINPVKVIEEEYHLSYPFIFKISEKYYLIPESSENRTIDLYECTSFPNGWKKVNTLMKDVNAVDTTLFFHNNLWWMFTTVASHPGISSKDETFLFYSEKFNSNKWIPHPKNPIISDVRKARQAGRIFEHNNKLYRLGQDCSHNYGYGISFNEILLLSKSEYSEKTVDKIEPNWEYPLKGTHTYDSKGGLTIVDGFWKTPRIHF